MPASARALPAIAPASSPSAGTSAPGSSTDSRTRAPAPTCAPGPITTGPSSRAPVADPRALAEQHRPVELDLVAEPAAGVGVDELAGGLDVDRAREHVEVALQVLGQRADVVPVGVGDVDAERDVVLEQRREDVEREVDLLGVGEVSKISGSST